MDCLSENPNSLELLERFYAPCKRPCKREKQTDKVMAERNDSVKLFHKENKMESLCSEALELPLQHSKTKANFAKEFIPRFNRLMKKIDKAK